MTEVDASKMRCKGSVLRGYLAVLEHDGLLATVRERASPELRGVIESPPAASAWIPSAPTEEISAIVASVEGLARCRAVSRTAALDGVVPLLRKAIEGFLRLFGAKPSTLLSRMEVLTKSTMEGIEYAWESTDPHSGFMTFRYPFRRTYRLRRSTLRRVRSRWSSICAVRAARSATRSRSMFPKGTRCASESSGPELRMQSLRRFQEPPLTFRAIGLTRRAQPPAPLENPRPDFRTSYRISQNSYAPRRGIVALRALHA